MKNSVSLLFLCLLALMSNTGVQAQTKTIERPAFDIRNNPIIEIDKILISDTATVLYIDAFSAHGNWITMERGAHIKQSGTTQNLYVKYSDGISLDDKFYMPESGTISFKLIFPPIDKNTTQIDFIEGDCESCFRTWGIYLNGQSPSPAQFPKEVTVAENKNKPLPTPQIKSGTAILSGQIIGGNLPSEMLSQGITLYMNNPITQTSEEIKVPLNEDGTFRQEINLPMASAGYMYSPFYRSTVFLIPGEETKIYVDAKRESLSKSRFHQNNIDAQPSAYIISSMGLSASDLAKSEDIYRMIDQRKIVKDIYNMTPEEYKSYLLNKLDENIKEIRLSEAISEQMKQLIINNIKIEFASMLLSYPRMMKISYVVTNNLSYNAIDTISYKPQNTDKAYYSFLKDFDLNNPVYLYSGIGNVVKSIREQPIYNIPKEKTSMSAWLQQAKSVLKDDIGSDSGLFYDLLLTNEYMGIIGEMKPLKESDKIELKKLMANPALTSILLSENKKTEELIAENANKTGYTVHETPDVPEDQVLDAILAKYKGKAIFVDFWATWCGPCRGAMQSALPIKEEMKGKDVVFIYLTNLSSPMKTWQQMIPDIHGEHYRVNDKIWAHWAAKYDIQGIPAYFIYDREGNRKHQSTGFMGVDNMRKWLLECME